MPSTYRSIEVGGKTQMFAAGKRTGQPHGDVSQFSKASNLSFPFFDYFQENSYIGRRKHGNYS